MSSQLNSRSAGLVAVSLAWAVFLTIIGSPEVMLFTVPVFMLAAPLALGRYMGDELVGRIRLTRRPAARRATDLPERFIDLPGSTSSSLLIALNLAGRAPPVASA